MAKFVPKQNNDNNVIYVYSDGGCRSTAKKGETIKATDKSAYAFFLKNGGHELLDGEAGYGATNNAMEIKGLLEALKKIKVENLPVIAHLDSAYVVNTIEKKWYVKWRNNGWTKDGGLANAELWKELIEQIERFPFFQIKKVKGHSTNEYNNLVDSHLNKLMDDLEKPQEDDVVITPNDFGGEPKKVNYNKERYDKNYVIDKLQLILEKGAFTITSDCADEIGFLIDDIRTNKIKIG